MQPTLRTARALPGGSVVSIWTAHLLPPSSFQSQLLSSQSFFLLLLWCQELCLQPQLFISHRNNGVIFLLLLQPSFPKLLCIFFFGTTSSCSISSIVPYECHCLLHLFGLTPPWWTVWCSALSPPVRCSCGSWSQVAGAFLTLIQVTVWHHPHSNLGRWQGRGSTQTLFCSMMRIVSRPQPRDNGLGLGIGKKCWPYCSCWVSFFLFLFGVYRIPILV